MNSRMDQTEQSLLDPCNSLDDGVVRAPASRAEHSGLIPSRVKPMALKLVFTAAPLEHSALRGLCEEQAGKFTRCAVRKGT